MTLTSRTLDWQTEPVGEVQSVAPGFESLSYQSGPFRIDVNLVRADAADLRVVAGRAHGSRRVGVRPDVCARLRLDRLVDRTAARTAGEVPGTTAGERRGVGLRLQMLRVRVPVTDPDDDASEREEHGEQEREHDDDLSALAHGIRRRRRALMAVHAATPVRCVASCSSRMVALPLRLSVPSFMIARKVYGASRVTRTGVPTVPTGVVGSPSSG